MKLAILALALAAALSAQTQAQAQAQPKADDHAAHHAAAADAALADGEVRKVDKEAGKITLKHAEIKSLDMPPMTMVFGVADKALLDQVKAGDKVKFKATAEGGRYTVTEIRVVR